MASSIKPLSLLVFALAWQPLPASAESTTLPNGVRLVVVPRGGDSKIQAGWVMTVGSVDERPGETGQARIVARLLDDGTRTIGTRDPVRERQLMEEADGLRARRPWVADPTALDDRLAEIARELERIQDLAAFRRSYEGAGITPPRATVGEDSTIFTTELEPDQLETWFRLEAARLTAPVFRRIEAALADARAELDAEGLLNVAEPAERRFRLAAWDGHPYAWPPTGLAFDLPRLSRYLLETFQRQYSPDRLTVVLVGPVTLETARALAERWLALWSPPANRARSRGLTLPPAGERGFAEAVDTVPRLIVEYRVPGAGEPGGDALALLARLLGGREGRLQKALETAGMNASARVRFEPRRLLGSLRIEVVARIAGPDARTFLPPLDREIARLTRESVTAEELEQARAGLTADLAAEAADSARLARALLLDAGMGQPERTLGLAEAVGRLTPADLQRAASVWLVPTVRTVGVLQPGG
jgi:predicted Zn-dependent peptidase